MLFYIFIGNIGHYHRHCILFFLPLLPPVSFIHYVIDFVGLSAVTLPDYLINAHPVVSLAKLYVIMSSRDRRGQAVKFDDNNFVSAL